MVHLARAFHPRLCIFITDVDGIYDKNPDDPSAKLLKRLDDDTKTRFQSMPSRDATGGIAGKVMSMLEMARDGFESFLLNGNHPERLGKVLRGEDTVGTIAR